MKHNETGNETDAARAVVVKPAVRKVGRRAVVRVAITAATALMLLGLVVLKVVIHPAWLVSARGGAVECLGGDDGGSGRSADRLHRVGRLGCVVARLEPVRTDYLELSVALLLVALLVGEVRLLTRNRDIRHGQGLPRPVPDRDGRQRLSRRRPPGPRTEPASPVSPRADRTGYPDRSDGP